MTFTYKVVESGSVPGVTNDASPKEFSVVVRDRGTGEMDAFYHEVDLEDGALFTFTNHYVPNPKESSITDYGQISVRKSLEGRSLQAGEFEFELYDVNAKKVVSKGTNDEYGAVTFDSVTYSEPGMYEYRLYEVKSEGASNGITYDSSTHIVSTVVTDNGDGTLSVKHTLVNEDGQDTSDEVIFKNTYLAAPTTVSLAATKVLHNAVLADGQFEFQLLDASGNLVESVGNKADGSVVFGALEFKAAGEYEYSIVEVNDKQENISYDDSAAKVKVNVADEGTGVLLAQTEIVSGDLVFENTYNEPLPDTGDDSPAPGGDSEDDEAKKNGSSKSDALSQTGDGLFVIAARLALLISVAASVLVLSLFMTRSVRS